MRASLAEVNRVPFNLTNVGDIDQSRIGLFGAGDNEPVEDFMLQPKYIVKPLKSSVRSSYQFRGRRIFSGRKIRMILEVAKFGLT